MSTSTEHAVVLSIQRIDMSRTAKSLWNRLWISQSLNGFCTIMSRYSCRTTIEFIDCYRERRAKHRCIISHLVWQIQFFCTRQCNRSTQHTAGMLEHEVHSFSGNFFCCNNQIAFIFTVLIVHNDNKLSLLKILEGVFNTT